MKIVLILGMNLNLSICNIILSILFLTACSDGKGQEEINLEPTKVKIENEIFDFGIIKQNSSVSIDLIHNSFL